MDVELETATEEESFPRRVIFQSKSILLHISTIFSKSAAGLGQRDEFVAGYSLDLFQVPDHTYS
jgi:hypothetical protein